jgi:hypothetical protein
MALMGVLAGLQDPDTELAQATYAAVAARLVGGMQRRSATFAITYLAQLSPPAPGTVASLDRALDGALVTAGSPVATSPVLRLLARLSEGDDEPVARQAAGSYAGALATGDLQAAQRGGLEEGARAGGRRVRGWRKELAPGACEWCVMIASGGGRYRQPDTVPFHQRDHCGVAPVFADN